MRVLKAASEEWCPGSVLAEHQISVEPGGQVQTHVRGSRDRNLGFDVGELHESQVFKVQAFGVADGPDQGYLWKPMKPVWHRAHWPFLGNAVNIFPFRSLQRLRASSLLAGRPSPSAGCSPRPGRGRRAFVGSL